METIDLLYRYRMDDLAKSRRRGAARIEIADRTMWEFPFPPETRVPSVNPRAYRARLRQKEISQAD
jgi:hypothetical protein